MRDVRDVASCPIDSGKSNGSNPAIAQPTVAPAQMARFRFGAFMLDVECARLQGPEGDIRLRAKAFRVLAELLDAAPQVVSTERLLDRVWGTRHLTRNTVAQTIQEVRQALKGGSGELIENLPKLGYRIAVAVERSLQPEAERPSEPGDPAPAAAATPTAPAAPAASPAPAARFRRPQLALLAALSVIVAAALWWRSDPGAPGFTSAADTGIRIDGRGTKPIQAALRRAISQQIERDWQIRPVDLSGVAGDTLAPTPGAELARRFRVDTWYGGRLSLREQGEQRAIDGELVIGSGRGNHTLTVPVQGMPLAEVPALAARVATLLGEVASWDPPDPAAHTQLPPADAARITEAEVATARGRPDTAQALLDGVSAPAKTHPDYLQSRARALLLQGRGQAVLALLPSRPQDDSLQLLWAQASGDHADAVAIAERRFRASPASARHGREFVEAILRAGDHARALAELDQIEQRSMSEFDRDEFVMLRAMVLNAQGAHPEAERLLAGLVRSLQDLGASELLLRARREQALAISMLGRWDEALAVYNEVAAQAGALGLARLEASAMFHIADIRKAQGQTADAADLLRQAISRFAEPDFADLLPDLHLGLAYIAMDSGDIGEAERAAEATHRMSLDMESDLLAATVAALRSEIALVRLQLPQSIALMEQSVSATCAGAAYGDAARLLLRLSARYLLVGETTAAGHAALTARRACQAVGSPGSCRTFTEVQDAILNQGARDGALLQRVAAEKRPLRDYAAATLALLRTGAVDAAAAGLAQGEAVRAQAPAHYQALWALVARLVALRAGHTIAAFPAELEAPFPQMARATADLAAAAGANAGGTGASAACAQGHFDFVCTWTRDPPRSAAFPSPPSDGEPPQQTSAR
jgi:DNA-binding winged helix-turn-helix (wHTH) protein/tetratricopeptide (TPR) repeat protein